jgi:flagellar basal body P-ring formation protein FlgA
MAPILRPPRRRQGTEQASQGGPIHPSARDRAAYIGGVDVRPCPALAMHAAPPARSAGAWRGLAAGLGLALAAGLGGARASDVAAPAFAVPAVNAVNATAAAALTDWMRARAEEAAPRPGARLEVELGAADPRLRLAACARAEPYLPATSRPWGRTRVGLRCVDGPVRWNVTLPVTVRVLAPAAALREPLPAGAELAIAHFTEAEVDWAAEREPPLVDPADMVGQRLARALPAGAAPRPGDLQRRRWFAAGERVQVVAAGAGWRVSTEGQALSAGIDGQRVRVRTEGGRIVSGLAVGERQVEVPL